MSIGAIVFLIAVLTYRGVMRAIEKARRIRVTESEEAAVRYSRSVTRNAVLIVIASIFGLSLIMILLRVLILKQ